MRVIISLFSVMEGDCSSMIFSMLACHTSFGVAHGCARGASWLVTTCQDVECAINDLTHGM